MGSRQYLAFVFCFLGVVGLCSAQDFDGDLSPEAQTRAKYSEVFTFLQENGLSPHDQVEIEGELVIVADLVSKCAGVSTGGVTNPTCQWLVDIMGQWNYL